MAIFSGSAEPLERFAAAARFSLRFSLSERCGAFFCGFFGLSEPFMPTS